jgi:hypothetical protein
MTSFPEFYDEYCLSLFPLNALIGAAESESSWFLPSFLAAVRAGTSDALRAIVHVLHFLSFFPVDFMQEDCPGVFSFDVFQPEFCRRLMADIRLYEASDLPKTRPNSMNNYGLIVFIFTSQPLGLVVNDIGLERRFDRLMHKYIQPFAALLLPQATAGFPLDHHHSFVVEYREVLLWQPCML